MVGSWGLEPQTSTVSIPVPMMHRRTRPSSNLHRKMGLQRLRALLQDLSVQPIPVMYEQGFFLEVLDWLTKYADHEPDWADACLAVRFCLDCLVTAGPRSS